MEYIKPTIWKFDIHRLQTEVADLLKRLSFDDNHAKNQISLTSRKGAETPIYDGVGSLWNRDKQCRIAEESEFTEFNDEFAGTYLEQIYNTINSEVRLGRVRLLRLQPGRCYSFHTDTETRYHLAVQTNKLSVILYRDAVPYHVPADGIVYHMDAKHQHTALNGTRDGQNRIHVVFNGID